MRRRSFQEVMNARKSLIERRSVWVELRDHIGKFLNTDIGPASMAIKTETEDIAVSQVSLLAVQGATSAMISEITCKIETIDASEMQQDEQVENVRSKRIKNDEEVADEKPGKKKKTGPN